MPKKRQHKTDIIDHPSKKGSEPVDERISPEKAVVVGTRKQKGGGGSSEKEPENLDPAGDVNARPSDIIAREMGKLTGDELARRKRNQGNQPKWERYARIMYDIMFDGDHESGELAPALFLTDKELVQWVNEQIDPEDRIGISTFEDYKAGRLNGEGDKEITVRLFGDAYSKALRIQKRNIFKNLQDDVPGSWQKWAWIAERKFAEWNPRIQEGDKAPPPKRLVFKPWEDPDAPDEPES